MLTLSKNFVLPASLTRRNVLIVAAAIGAGLFFGLLVPVYAGLMGASVAKLAALPAVLALLLLLVYDAKTLFIGILLFRSVGDIVLETTRFSVGGADLGVGAFVNAAVIGMAVLFSAQRPHWFPRKLAGMWLPFTLICLGALVIAPVKGEAIRVFLALLSYLAMFISGTYLVRSRDDFVRVVRLVVLSSILPACYAFVDIALNHADVPFRLRSTFGHANIFAFYLLLILSLSLYLIKSPHVTLRPLWRWTLTGYMVLLLGMLVLTQTRSAWIACVAVFAIYALFFERKYLIYLALAPVLALMIPTVRDRIMSLDSGNDAVQYAKLNSFAWRVLLWESGLHFMRPVRYAFGYGLEAFRYYSLDFFPLAGGINWSPHNLYVQWIFDIGLVGLTSYLSIFARVLLRIRKLLAVDRLAAVILIAVTIAYLIVSASDNLFAYLAFNWYFWVVLGSACALVSVELDAPPAAAGSVRR
ncbi:O-antigen ligase [Duganella sp. 1224]|uniref:O-antigen ligase family protein n=1 Tax=Duganella sp. 1224 TaxID=2587052 RepID=UPI0015CE52D0|nr:O-antigen ligase family protein [Duganella sp. 1224]NYE62161.1 O-antigen ligase [Duganella sp. 1224]